MCYISFVYPAIERLKNLPLRLCARRHLGSSVRPEGPRQSWKFLPAAVHSRTIWLDSGAGAGSDWSQSGPEIIGSQLPWRKCGLELLWCFGKWKESGKGNPGYPGDSTTFWLYTLSIGGQENNQMKNISRGELQRSISGCAGQWGSGLLFQRDEGVLTKRHFLYEDSKPQRVPQTPGQLSY